MPRVERVPRPFKYFQHRQDRHSKNVSWLYTHIKGDQLHSFLAPPSLFLTIYLPQHPTTVLVHRFIEFINLSRDTTTFLLYIHVNHSYRIPDRIKYREPRSHTPRTPNPSSHNDDRIRTLCSS